MEENMRLEQVISLIGELKQGKELAKQLFDHLASPSPSPSPSSSSSSSSSSTHETNEVLIEKILSIYEKALTMLNSKANNNMLVDIPNCPSFANGSPKSVLDQEVVKHKYDSKKRKTCLPRWTKQVEVSLGTAIDGSMDDGYFWRKYGQKDILGAKFPRAYYRCTHRNAQGCLATKQVQKSDLDPTILEISYKGRHTCIQSSNNHSHNNKATTTTTLIPSKKPKVSLEEEQEENNKNQQQPSQETTTMFTFGSSLELEVKIEDLDTKQEDNDIFSIFGYNNNNNNMFCDDHTTMIDNNFMMDQCFSPQFMSPSTSGTNIFCQLGSNGSESDDIAHDMISNPSSVANSPMVGLDFLLENVDFDAEFPIESPELFS